MPRYTYTGTLLDGQEVKGVLLAENPSDLEIKLVNRGITVAQVRPALSKIGQLSIKYLKAGEITKSTRQLAILLKSKIPLIESLSLVSEQIKDKSLRTIFRDIIKQVESGRSLAKAFSEYPLVFDELFTSMIEAGEISGNLEFSFDKLADYREKSEAMGRKVKSALAYPALVVAVAILVVFVLILYVVPVFSSMYENFGAELPKLTRYVVQISEYIRSSFWYWLSGMIVLSAAFLFFSASKQFRLLLERVSLKIPYVGGLVTKLISARFSRTLGSLLTAGVDIIYGLEVSTKSMGNLYATSLLANSGSQLMEGKTLTSVLDQTRIFPRTMLRMVESGEKTGQLGEMLTYAADFYEHETNSEISTLTTLIEPVVIIILGAFIAFILVAMYLPLFELVGTI